MEQLAQSPFFPVPVRWFELPVSTARWGFARLQEITESGQRSYSNSDPASDRSRDDASSAQSDAGEPRYPALDRPAVGRLLNERA